MEQYTIDHIDEAIIAELTKNARISHAELAQRVLLSRNAVRQRISRLERRGHIQGYTVVAGAPGQHVVSAMLLVYRKDRMRGADVLAALRTIPEVVLCDVLSGDFDLLVRLEARSLDRIQVIWEQIASLPGVNDTVTALTLSTVIRRPSTATASASTVGAGQPGADQTAAGQADAGTTQPPVSS